jgi:hypothetical protein
MSVDSSKPRKILCVHGVQTGRDADIDRHEVLRELINDRLNRRPLKFETEMYKYEKSA